MCHFSRNLVEAPAKRLHLVASPILGQHSRLEKHKQIVSQDTDAKKDRVGMKLPAGHPLHAKTDLQFLDPVLTRIAAQIAPAQRLLGALAHAVAGDDVMVLGRLLFSLLLILEQVPLHRALHHNQTERLLRVFHTMHRLGDEALSVRTPVRFGNRGNCLPRRRIQMRSDGEGNFLFLTPVEDIRLIRRGVGAQLLDALAFDRRSA